MARTYEISRGTVRAVQFAALELKLYALIERLERGSWLERRYAPDQPRVPAGNSDGGQWTIGVAGNRRDRSRRVAAELTLLGTLHSQIRLRDESLLCIYDFGLQHWMIPSATKVIGCPGLMTQSIFAHGTRLNDNYRMGQ